MDRVVRQGIKVFEGLGTDKEMESYCQKNGLIVQDVGQEWKTMQRKISQSFG